MDTVHLILIGSGLLAVVITMWRLLGKPTRCLPYTNRPSLLTPAELRFYRVLVQAVPSGVAVFVKVRLMDVVAVPDNDWQEHGARGSGMHVDFVLVDASTLSPRLAIELDDRSHFRPDVKERDAFKDAALSAAGVPVLRVTAAGKYDLAPLRVRVKKAVC